MLLLTFETAIFYYLFKAFFFKYSIIFFFFKSKNMGYDEKIIS